MNYKQHIMEDENDSHTFIDVDEEGGEEEEEEEEECEEIIQESPTKRLKTEKEEDENTGFVSVYDVDNELEVLEEVPVGTMQEPKEEQYLESGQCPICLQKMDNPAIPECCSHRFCFICILQWSSLVPSCPLCKKHFSYLIHHVKSEKEYKIFHIEQQASKPHTPSSRTTHSSSSTTTPRPSSSTHPAPTSTDIHALRRAVYARGLRVQPPPNLTLTASMQEHPSFLNRLKPWITRDLQAILLMDNVEIIMQVVISLLKQHSIHHPAVAEHLKEYLGEHTDIFLHELLCFACSSHPSMVVYDKHVRYDKHKPDK